MLATAPVSATVRPSRAASKPASPPEPLTVEQLVALVLLGEPGRAVEALGESAALDTVVEVTDPEIGWTYEVLLSGGALPAPAAVPVVAS